jgi:hypothetical protein
MYDWAELWRKTRVVSPRIQLTESVLARCCQLGIQQQSAACRAISSSTNNKVETVAFSLSSNGCVSVGANGLDSSGLSHQSARTSSTEIRLSLCGLN